MSVVSLDDYKEAKGKWLVVVDVSGRKAHVVPESMLRDFIDGKLPMNEIDEGESFFRAIVSEWLDFMLDG